MKSFSGIRLMHHQLFHSIAIILLLILVVCSCRNGDLDEQFKRIEINRIKPAGIVINYPLSGSVFPPEFPPQLFSWKDTMNRPAIWHIRVSAQNGKEICHEVIQSSKWRPDSVTWLKIKSIAGLNPVSFTIIGVGKGLSHNRYSSGRTSFTFSADSVGASVFYRAVPLPFGYAVTHVKEIEWYSCNVDGEKPHKVMDNIPVCANCHSFSGNGTMAMDIDYANDKGSYIISPVKDTVMLSFDKIITWSDFKREEGGATFGLLSQISPDGRYVLSTVKDRSIFVALDNLEYSQLFFPIKGIIAVYDRNKKNFFELPGASDKRYVQSNPNWAPDGNEILFSRAFRYKSSKIDNTESVLLKAEDAKEFITGQKEFKYDLCRIPFNEGAGGQAVPVPGASNNKKSNFFARYSPDGKWIVFCQSENFMLLQPDSKLYIMKANGGTPRLMKCNSKNMNSWHSWSPNSKWLVFSSKSKGPYTQLYLTHIDENGNDSPPVFLENMAFDSKAANIPEFLNNKVSGMDKMIDEFSGTALYFTRLASISTLEKKYTDALRDVDCAIKADSTFFEGYEQKLYLNFILRRSKSTIDLQERLIAKRLINRQIQRNPENYSLYIKRGNLRLLVDDYEGALQDGMRVLKANHNFSAYQLLMATYQEMGQPANAITYQKKMLELQPDNINLTNNLALLYKDTKQFEQSLVLLKEIITRFPKNAEGYIARAEVKLLQGDRLSGKADCDKAISVAPDNYLGYRARGTFYMNASDADQANKDYNRAITLLEKEIAVNPQDAPLYIIHAELLEKVGNREAALNAYENYLSIWPLNYSALKRTAEMYFLLKQYTQAVTSYTKLIENFPENDGSLLCARGYIYQQLGNLQKAMNDLNQAVRLDPADYSYYYYRSEICYQLGDMAGYKKDRKVSANILHSLKKTRNLNKEEEEILSVLEDQL